MTANIRLDTSGLDKLSRELETDADNALLRVARQVEALTKANIMSKNIIDTGALFGSIAVSPRGKGVYWVHDGVEYGIYHELGTHRIAARPFMTPAVETVYLQVVDIIKGGLGL